MLILSQEVKYEGSSVFRIKVLLTRCDMWISLRDKAPKLQWVNYLESLRTLLFYDCVLFMKAFIHIYIYTYIIYVLCWSIIKIVPHPCVTLYSVMRIGLDKITYRCCDILKFFLEKILDRLEDTVRSREDLKFLSEGIAYVGHLWKHVAKNKSTVPMTWIWHLITKGQRSSFLSFSLRTNRNILLFSTHVGSHALFHGQWTTE